MPSPRVFLEVTTHSLWRGPAPALEPVSCLLSLSASSRVFEFFPPD